jgi:hypothetical protein
MISNKNLLQSNVQEIKDSHFKEEQKKIEDKHKD